MFIVVTFLIRLASAVGADLRLTQTVTRPLNLHLAKNTLTQHHTTLNLYTPTSSFINFPQAVLLIFSRYFANSTTEQICIEKLTC
jgi:hypothetical protein